ncbi:endoribonuclease ysh1 [Friedmanniomyces endolithicus]|nr:endoribonuclease ysh1 [Friedmanniomyces endolithicus]KAK0280390.1 endoribonuclease ysh1 [Friedmanniomyces endolithicus]KAK1017845.1 endoribonuclease ysh1 [Friedmanniomyces endolithicus]
MANKRPHAAIDTPTPNSTTKPAPASAVDNDDDDPIDPSDELTFIALGGGNEVGRSCHIVQYKGKTVMLDAGIHPAYDGLAALPFYDEFDLSTVDVLLITHFHMDHAASLPYVLAKTNFAGRVYMTHPTKAIYKHLMQDSVRVQNTHISTSATTSGTDGYIHQLFTEHDILSTLPQIQTISFNTTHVHNGIRFTPYPAGHVLGACMYLIEIAGLNILFTGDYSRENDRHLIPASVPRGVKIDCLITESTFGISTHVPRLERETALMKSITGILNRGGRALLPVFAIGRAQELLLIFEDYWTKHEEYRRYPIYYASSLARKCMVVYQTYIDAMNDNIRAKFQAGSASVSNTAVSKASDAAGENASAGTGPWDFQYIRSLKSLERFDDVGGCVMLASPGMLQNGVSRSLLERWAPDPRNGVVITGYSVEGTMAKQIMLEPDSIPAVMTNRQPQNGGAMGMGKRAGGGEGHERVMVPRRCTVQEYSFAAHVDGSENREFIEEVGAPVVILVHGEKHNMNRLKSRLLGLQSMKVFSPANCEELRIPFRREKVARVVGRLARDIVLPAIPTDDPDEDVEGEVKRRRDEGQLVSGVLVQNDFKLSLMAPEDLKEFAGLTTTTIVCRQRITLAAAGVELIRWALESTFGGVTIVPLNPTEGKTNGDDTSMIKAQYPTNGHMDENTVLEIMGGAVRLTHHAPSGEVEMEWEGNVSNDSIADAVMAVLLSVESSPAAVRQSSKIHSHSHSHQQETEQTKSYDAFGDSPVDTKLNGDAFAVSKHEDSASNGLRKRNPHANITPEERLNRLFMFLEAQFGEDALSPIPYPRPQNPTTTTTTTTTTGTTNGTGYPPTSAEQDKSAIHAELARLHSIGIPVPGLEIRVDRLVARVWLEGLEVECGNKTLGDRVRAVVERGCGTLAPLWG